MFRKILVANRGEIAVRAFRAATELGVGTVAVFPYEDRFAEYRLKADESYQIGEVGHPVRAYLDVDGIIHAALEAEADAIYPGYGFLSENPDLAQACEEHGITFVGPDHTILELTGDKAAAIAAARAAGLPTLKGSDPSDDPDTLIAAAEEIGFPVFVKAVSGGGGRGMRRVENAEALPAALAEAMREAKAAFADLVALVGLQPVLGETILVGEHGDGLDAELGRGAERAHGDLAAVGDQDLGEHGLTLVVCP